jgi:cysteinyl-tRNA synthetase
MRPLTLFNTLSKRKELFVPLKPGYASVYVCGITIYDDVHIGHLKSIMTFEWLRGYLESMDIDVHLVRNFTDVDDKIIAKAVSTGTTVQALTDGYIRAYRNLMEQLGIPPARHEPRVSEYLPEINRFITQLVSNEDAYSTEDGVYFDTQRRKVSKLPLSGQTPAHNLNDLHSSHKRHPNDFALWKKDLEHGFESDVFKPLGRLGWHIECSAMHHALLGPHFDIHGGGRDLIFPHHENEIAQSLAHNGVQPATTWMHNGMMTKNGQKISKSGTPIHVKDLLLKHTPEAILFFLLKGHYRQSQELNESEMRDASEKMIRFRDAASKANQSEDDKTAFLDSVFEALSDDLNTPQVVRLFNSALSTLEQTRNLNLASEMLNALKLLRVFPQNSTLESISQPLEDSPALTQPSEHVLSLMNERLHLKKQHRWNEADRLRALIFEAGFVVTDNSNGATLSPRML